MYGLYKPPCELLLVNLSKFLINLICFDLFQLAFFKIIIIIIIIIIINDTSSIPSVFTSLPHAIAGIRLLVMDVTV